MNHNVRSYAVHGLGVRSEISLPLPPASPEAETDVDIRVGAVPEMLAAPGMRRGCWEAAPGVFLLAVDGVGRYLVRGGREITVQPAPGGDSSVSTFLLGSAMAACLKQRGVFTLHASAIATDEGAVLFAGASGSGKSTLLAALLDRGHEMLCDDVTGIVLNGGGGPAALPAYPRLRLWADAVEALGWNGRVQGRVREDVEKYLTSAERFRDAPLAVRGIFILTHHNGRGLKTEALAPGVAFERLVWYTYRRRYAEGLGQAAAQFRALAALAGQVPVARLRKPVVDLPVDALADRVESCLRGGWPKRIGDREAWTRRAARRPEEAAKRGLLRERARNPIVWLASYPRSGNTWMRALLTNYLEDGDGPASIEALIGGPDLIQRQVADEQLGLSSSDLTEEETLRMRSRFYESWAADLPRPSFIKVHDACLRTADGSLLFPSSVTLGAVYVVRDPLDVAVSTAHFWNRPVARSVSDLCCPDAALSRRAGGIWDTFPQSLLSWSGHAASWLDQTELPVHAVRYEDLLADTAAAFGPVLRFAGIEPEAERLSRAVDRARLARLRAQERRSGFWEKPPTARAFFRSGRAGAWRGALSRDQVRALIDAHGPVMERFGYLDGAEAFLADGA